MSIASILESSPDWAHLAPYAVPGGQPPPDGASLHIWTYLAETLFPGTLSYALKDVHPSHRPLRTFLVLAQAARLKDHTFSDAKKPSEEVWHRQIEGVNSYLEFRERFRAEKVNFISEYNDLQQRGQHVSEQIDDIDRQWAELDAEHVQKQYQDQSHIVDQLQSQLNEAESLRSELVQRKELSAKRSEELQRDLDSLRQQLESSKQHTRLLDLVIKTGVQTMETSIAQTLEDVSRLEAQHRQQQATLELYKYTMHVFDELIPMLQNLLAIETEIITKKEQRNTLEINQLRPLLLRAQEIRQQIKKSTDDIERNKSQAQELRSEIEVLDAELAKESSYEPETDVSGSNAPGSTESEEDGEIKQVSSKLAELKAEEKELKAVINMQRLWLKAMNDVEKWAADLAKENEQIRKWMTDYLKSR